MKKNPRVTDEKRLVAAAWRVRKGRRSASGLKRGAAFDR